MATLLPLIIESDIKLPVKVSPANVGVLDAATACPIATSFALTVTPVPAPTARVLVDAMVPPPVRPAPAVIVTLVWSMCSFATKFANES